MYVLLLYSEYICTSLGIGALHGCVYVYLGGSFTYTTQREFIAVGPDRPDDRQGHT